MHRKGQAAMEFLMTYGWAILVVLVAIGALAYFGVLSPNRFLPSSCTIGPGIGCDDFKVLAAGTATLKLRNGMGEDLTAVTVSLEGQASSDCADVAMADGVQLTCAFSGLTTGTAGSKYKADITFAYTGSGGLTHSKTGILTTKYE